MRKKVYIALLIVLLVGSMLLAGCQSNVEPPVEGETPAEGEAAFEFPTKPIELLVPMGAGGGSDVMARTIAATIDEIGALPEPLVVSNMEGASGAIGWSHVAAKTGDPYIISTTSGSFFTANILGNSPIKYDMFQPIASLAKDVYLLCVRSGSSFDNLQDLVDASKTSQGARLGSTSLTSTGRILTAQLEKAADTTFTFVPFEGGGDLMVALLGGHIDFSWNNPSEVLGQIEAGEIRALAVASPERLKKLPDVPTTAEAGYPDVVFELPRGVVAPLGIPEKAIKVLEQAFYELSQSKEWQEGYLEKMQLTNYYMNAEEFSKELPILYQRYEDAFRMLELID